MTLNEEIKEQVIQLCGCKAIVDDWGEVADELSRSFEWVGSKIRWSTVKAHKSSELKGGYNNWLDQIKEFISISDIDSEINNSDEIYYINDSSLDFSVHIEPSLFYSFLDLVINNIPQHHYFFDKGKKWCLVVSSEAYVDFGFPN